ncbi:MAG: choice-of-anchor D domain-containing protein [Planctomycetota bacterium]|nr:choice-of-anchor D domain-containing protein [Planctomycetota bacterium]
MIDLNTGTAPSINGGAAGGLVASGASPDDNSIENAFGGDGNDMIAGDNDNNILGDGLGSDTLWGDSGRETFDPTGITSGDDTFRLEPANNQTDDIYDVAGNDTIDFRFASAGVVYDADIVGIQDVFNLGNNANVNLRLHQTLVAGFIPQPVTGNTPYENVVGSQFDDIIDIDPLSISGNFPTNIPVNRFVDGNSPVAPATPGDTLNFDAKGQVVIDTGLSLTSQGVGTVGYASIETLTSFDDAPRFIDNGDDAFTLTPLDLANPARVIWTERADDGFGGSYVFSFADNTGGLSPHTATWTANGVSVAQYRVSITWPENITPNDPSDVPVQVFDGDTLLASLTINQQLRPSDLLDEGVLWHDLGIFTFQSHTARVVMSNETDRSVHADAIRLEQISPGPELRVELQDTGAYLIDAVDIVNVTTTLEVPTTRTFTITNEGTTDLTINDIELEQGVGTNWVLTPAVVTSFTLTPGESSFVTVTLLATTANGQADFPAELRIFSNDVDENVSQHLGQGVNPNPDGDPLNDVNPFTVPLNGVVSTADIIDDLDLRFDLIGNWGGPDSTEDPFGTGHRITANDGSGDRAIFRFDDLPDGRYRISTTWDSGGTLQLTTARYRVLDFSTVLNTVDVNQKIEPVGINDSGSIFQDLGGPYDITGGTIIVELLDTNVNGSTGTVVIADAVRIERLFDMVADATLLVSDDSFVTSSTEVADDTGVVSFGTVFPGAQVQKTFRVRNDGALPLTVREPISLPDAYTLISFNGVPPTNATEVELTNNGDFVDFVVQLNAATVGTISGELSFFTGELAGGLEADPDENPVNVTLTATIQNTVIIDDQDAAGFTLAGTGFQTFIGYQGYHNEVHVVAGNGTGTNTATWTFTVDPGSTYRLGTSYTPFGNRATNAPYTIAGVTGGSTVVPINQQLTPNDRVVNGSAFEDLGVFIASGNTITVTLSDAGNGQTIADAVRLEALFGPEIEVSDDATGTNLQSAASSVDVGDVAQGAANLQRTFTITNDGQRALAVAAISLPSHYQFVGAVPTSVAAAVGGVPGSASFTVELTTADAGTYGGTVSIINDDADETPFSFNITGTVIGALGVDAFIIDSSDGPTAFSTVGSYSVFTGFGRNNSFEAAFAGDGSSVATWSFTGLTPGVYNVAATWTDYINRADDAPYTITDSTGSTTIDINQFKAPDDFTANGSTWERLPGSFVVDGTGTLTVTLSNLSSAGYVDADAIRIDRIGALPEIVMLDLGPDQAFGGGNDSNLPDGGTYDFGATTPGTAVVQTFRIANPGTAALTIGTLTLPAGFTTTYSPQTIAANGGFLDFTITYAGLVDATGTFSFLTNDDDESPFNFTVTGAATPAVFTIDNTAVAGFAATGAFVEFSGQGVQNSVHYKTATPVGAGDTATWTFNAASVGTSPTVGGTYRVSATWSPNANRATDAPFTISGINGGPLTIDVNQKLAPSSFFEDGVEWFDLEVVHVSAGGEIVVTLGDSANGDVIADSIRIEALTPVVPEIVVHDSGQVVVDGGTVDFGTTTAGATLSKTFTLVNSGQSNLIVQAPALPAGFTTTFTGATITPGNTTDVVINVTTTIEAVFTGTLSFASNDSNESPFNVSLSAAVAPPAALIIDNDDAGFTPSAQFALWSGQGFQNDVREDNTPGTGTSTSTWTFTSVPAGQYRVSTTWSPFNNRATDAPYTISGFDGGPVTFDINQQVSPGDFQVDGASWEEFGFFTLSATGTITVSLSDDANGNVIADAVRLDPVVGSEITVLNGTTLIIDGGTLEFGSIVQGTTTAGAITRTITVRNDGPDNLVLQPIPALTGFTISNTNFTTDQIVASGATASFDITIDTSAVAALNATLEFGNNDIDEGPFNITLTGNITTNAVQILDNGDAGYTPSSDEVTFTGQGFQGDVGEDSSQGTAATPATWAFSNLVSGGVYRVSATWTEFSNRATDAPYTISGLVTGVGGGAGGMVTVDVNQRVAPNDRVDQGTSFEDLGVFTLTGTTLTVSLSDDADGNVIADAIRIERITGPEIQVDLAGTVLVSGTSTVDFGTHIVGVTETRTFTVTNLGATALTVGAVPDGAGFTVTSNLPGAAIAPLGNATFTITMNTAAINTFNETLSFTNDDADGDEAPFQFTVTGVVASASASVITDNGDSNYVQSGEFAYWTQQGFQNDVAEDNTPGSGASTATWTFLGLAAGTYRVSATWSAYFNRATNAPYSINGGGAITVNQQLSPSDVSFTSVVDSGVAFADLDGAFVFAGGTLTVTLSDSADGNVIADAIRVQRISALQVAGGEAAAGSHARSLTSDDVADIVNQAIVIWSATGLSAAEANALSTVTFDVRDLAAGDLGAASNGTIYLDINGAGYGWFVDHTPMLNEEFRITDATLTAIENGPAAGEIDLLTVVLHELGHLIGRDHSSNDNPGDLMSETLGVGIRRLPQRSVANTSLPALYPTSVEPPSDSLNSLLQTPLDGSRTPAELYADRQDEDLIDPQIQTAAAPPSAHENNGIDEIFTLLTDGDGVVTQIPFDEL